MHEMGIVSSVLDAVQRVAEKHPGRRPSKVGLRIGEWAGVDLASLRFCFEALAPSEGLVGLGLDIDYRYRQNRCQRCGLEFRVKDYEIQCPSCHSDNTVPAGGEELDIAYVDLEE